VKQFGVRKWAQISEKLDGRAGKQCRERWHNHLRPDIKVSSPFTSSRVRQFSFIFSSCCDDL
jgi:myb proto-oncogene protein